MQLATMLMTRCSDDGSIPLPLLVSYFCVASTLDCMTGYVKRFMGIKSSKALLGLKLACKMNDISGNFWGRRRNFIQRWMHSGVAGDSNRVS